MMKNIVKKITNIGKEILGLYLVFFSLKIIIPIATVMSFKFLVREVTLNLQVLTLVLSLRRERLVKFKEDQYFFNLEGQFDKDILTGWVVNGYYKVIDKFVIPMEQAIFRHEFAGLSSIISRLLSNPANITYMGAWVDVSKLLVAIKEYDREDSKWDDFVRGIR
jgi:hypothetical protein